MDKDTDITCCHEPFNRDGSRDTVNTNDPNKTNGSSDTESIQNDSIVKTPSLTIETSSIRNHIQVEIIQPNYMEEVNTYIHCRTRWHTVGILTETVSKLMICASTILSFASNNCSDLKLNFYAGSLSTVSMCCFQFAQFSFRESKKATENLNKILHKLHMESVPQINGLSKESPS